MVRGLDVFREYFAGHADQFVLIGGTAATLAMEDAGLEFRATKDLDIVLHIEALNAAFGEVFWKFVEEGRYEIRQASDTGNPVFYRFLQAGGPSRPRSGITTSSLSGSLAWALSREQADPSPRVRVLRRD